MGDRSGQSPSESETERYLRGAFLGALAHAIRSPIGVVQGAIDELRETRDPADLAWLLPMLDRGVERLLRLAHNLSLVRDIETRRLSVSLSECDLVTVARRGAESARDQADRLQLQLPPEPVSTTCDAAMIELALEQLVDNALRHGTGVVRITATKHPTPSIEVWDDGPGLSPDRLDAMAQRFVDARTRGANGDLALGLSIARDAAAMGGAELTLVAPPHGRGTLCRLQFNSARSSIGGPS